MLENMYVKNVSGTEVDIAVRDEDYGKLRGAEEGVYRNRLDSRGRPIKGAKTKVRRPFFHLSKNDKIQIVNDPVFTKVLKRAIKRLEK